MDLLINNMGVKMLLEELRNLVLEMYCAKIRIKMEVAISGITYDLTDLENLDVNFNKHLDLLEICLCKNDFDGINSIVEKFKEDLQRARIIAINLTITAKRNNDHILPVISSVIGDTIGQIDDNLAIGMDSVSKLI